MHAFAYQRLSQGYVTSHYVAGDFQYVYFLWFEDEESHRIVPAKVFSLKLDKSRFGDLVNNVRE